MANDNDDAYKPDPAALRELITTTLQAMGDGRIKPEEMPVAEHTKPQHIRYAPGFASSPRSVKTAQFPYTVNSLAVFQGKVGKDGQASEPFITAFNVVELIDAGWLTESGVAVSTLWSKHSRQPSAIEQKPGKALALEFLQG